jgi:hypothetical protein
MIILFLFLGALALLVALLLFGFVGCSTIIPALGEDYAGVIEQTGGLVSYWRLGDAHDTTPIPNGAAVDQVGGNNGTYLTLPSGGGSPNHYSPPVAGVATVGAIPGLLAIPQDSDPCFDTEGGAGYVQVPFKAELNPPQFTFEAWVSPDPILSVSPDGNFYCLAESTGPPGFSGPQLGWGIYLGPSAPGHADGPFWQVWMGFGPGAAPGGQYQLVLLANKSNPPAQAGTELTLTYLALTFDGDLLQLWLYYPYNNQSLDCNDVAAVLGDEVSVTNIVPNNSGDFFIGTGSNLVPAAPLPTTRLYPFRGRIQEVALYNVSLVSGSCGIDTLASHVAASGNL